MSRVMMRNTTIRAHTNVTTKLVRTIRWRRRVRMASSGASTNDRPRQRDCFHYFRAPRLPWRRSRCFPHCNECSPIMLPRTGYQGDEAVLADGEFVLEYPATACRRALRFHRAVGAGEVDDGAVAAGRIALHLHQRTRGARLSGLHREGPHLDARRVESFQVGGEDGFIEGLGPGHVLHIDFEPADGIACHGTRLA